MEKILLIIINLAIGSILLMAGVHFMSNALDKLGENRIKNVLNDNKLSFNKAFFVSIIATALTQSSTAIMVITITLVNSGIIGLTAAMGIIYGANIGTTFTAHLISLNISQYGLIVLILGLILKLRFKTAGNIIIGLGLMFCGIRILNFSIPYIQNSKEAITLLSKYGDNIVVGFIGGIIITILVQSSAAAVGLTMLLFNNGFITFNVAVALVMGDNIGTCASSIVASLHTNIWAKRTAWAHTAYNIVGSVLGLLLLTPFTAFIIFITQLIGGTKANLIPNTHTIFNIFSALLFIPFNKWYIKLITKIGRD